jgi:hypothetical protein
MTRRPFAVSLCLLLAAVLAAAQSRVEFRKAGETQMLYANGQAIATLRAYAESGFTTADVVREIQPGFFEWTRTFTYTGKDYVRPVRLTMELEALYESRYSLIPAVMYDGNTWGTGLEPKGFVKDGRPWTFAYHRSSIPGATYSESDAWSVGLFSVPGQISGGFSCIQVRKAEKMCEAILIWFSSMPSAPSINAFCFSSMERTSA